MAIYRDSPIIGPISGALGGTVIARSKAGPVLKHRPAKITRHTPAALAARARFADQTRAWARLTEEEREDWRQFARQHPTTNRLGIARPLTGFQWFLKRGNLAWDPTADGVTLHAGLAGIWTWSWTTATLYLDAGFDVQTSGPPAAAGIDPIYAPVWTSTAKALAICVAGIQQTYIAITDRIFTSWNITTHALESSTTNPAPAVAEGDYSYFNAWRPSTGQVETYMAVSNTGTISLAGSLDLTQTID